MSGVRTKCARHQGLHRGNRLLKGDLKKLEDGGSN